MGPKSDQAGEGAPPPKGGETRAGPASGKGGPVKKGIPKPRPAEALKGRVKPAKAAAMNPPPTPAKGRAKERPARILRGGVPFICSECYEEFVLPATYSRETLSCPECLHVGKRPDENFLRTVTIHKAGEQNALKMAFFLTYALIVTAFCFIWLVTPYSVFPAIADLRATLTTGMGGLAVVLALLLVWAVNRYEKNRWEIYF